MSREAVWFKTWCPSSFDLMLNILELGMRSDQIWHVDNKQSDQLEKRPNHNHWNPHKTEKKLVGFILTNVGEDYVGLFVHMRIMSSLQSVWFLLLLISSAADGSWLFCWSLRNSVPSIIWRTFNIQPMFYWCRHKNYRGSYLNLEQHCAHTQTHTHTVCFSFVSFVVHHMNAASTRTSVIKHRKVWAYTFTTEWCVCPSVHFLHLDRSKYLLYAP